MLASLIDALEGCRRLILVGDHRQLPPIGPGRPFYDPIRYLEVRPEKESAVFGGGIAYLTVYGRQRQIGEVGREDLATAALFATDRPGEPAADNVFNRVICGEGDDTVRILTWDEPDKLDSLLVQLITRDRGADLREGRCREGVERVTGDGGRRFVAPEPVEKRGEDSQRATDQGGGARAWQLPA